MNDDIKKCTDEALRNAVEALAVTITCTAKEFIACISKVDGFACKNVVGCNAFRRCRQSITEGNQKMAEDLEVPHPVAA